MTRPAGRHAEATLATIHRDASLIMHWGTLLSLHWPIALAVIGARTAFHLPYSGPVSDWLNPLIRLSSLPFVGILVRRPLSLRPAGR